MLQPFKFITVVMKERTNHGMEENTTGKPNMRPLIVLRDDMRYHPITLNDEGLGVAFDSNNSETHAMVGVLMESFNKTYAQHKVLVHGIVSMPSRGAVKAGMPVYWDYNQEEVSKDKASTTPYVGVAMTSGNQDGDHIDVLIG